ncbi:MAG: DUF6252 family protein [Bacteroidota bacterium]|nr:DUF6252 family protein [Bacteroidota bacterium]
MNRKLLMFFMLFAFVAMEACTKDDGTENAVKMSASIDGVQWDASFLAPTTLRNHKFIITGTNLAGGAILLSTSADTVGTYLLYMPLIYQFNGTYKVTTLSPTAKDIFEGLSGTLKLTKVDTVAKVVSGSYEFKGINSSLDSARVTKGIFMNVPYL